VEDDGGGCNQEDSKPPPVTGGSAQMRGSFPDQEVGQQEEARTTPGRVPFG
jgi:hypothetical protein